MIGFLAQVVRAPPVVLFGRGWPGVARIERFPCYSHLAGGLAAIAGGIVLVLRAPTPQLELASSVYAAGAVSMFFASTLYHAQKQSDDNTGFWRRVDHAAVFVMIAGTYTPVSYVYLSGAWCWGIISAQWLVALAGIVFKLVVVDSPRWITAGIYVGMGWMAVVPMPQLVAAMPVGELALLIGGGVAYTVGAAVYGLKRPDPWARVIGFHGVFHLLVLLGAALHYALIFAAV